MSESSRERIAIPGTDARQAQDDPSTRAARWLVYLRSGEATEQGERHFSDWLAHDANRAAYRSLEQWWRDIDHFAVNDAAPEPPAVVEEVAANATRRRRWGAAGLAMAASVAGLVGVAAWFDRPMPAPVAETRYASGVGQTRQVRLADGTRVVLGGDTALLARIAPDARSVRLLSGQAYFAVAHEADRPFTVSAAHIQARDIGTEFEVLNNGRTVRVSVAQGVVAVRSAAANAHGEAWLREGQRIEASPQGRLGRVEPFDPAHAFSWRTGQLYYDNAPLAEIVADVNRYRTVPIVLADPALGAMPITMAVPARETDRLLAGLEAGGRVHVARGPDRVLLSGR